MHTTADAALSASITGALKQRPLAHYSMQAADGLTMRPAASKIEHERIAAQLAELQAALAAAVDWVDDCGIRALEYVERAAAQWEMTYAREHDADGAEACGPNRRAS